MIHLIKKFKCKFVGHKLLQAGTCPFTGSTYDYCESCGMMIPREVAV